MLGVAIGVSGALDLAASEGGSSGVIEDHKLGFCQVGGEAIVAEPPESVFEPSNSRFGSGQGGG